MAQPKANANVHLQDQGLKQTWTLSIENQENAAFYRYCYIKYVMKNMLAIRDEAYMYMYIKMWRNT